MNKYKIYLLLALVVLAIVAITIWIRSNRCECAQFKKYKEVTVHPDLTIESREDSICVAGGKRNGDLMIRKFKD